jgi:hypothetical protein
MELVFETDGQAMQRADRISMFLEVLIKLLRAFKSLFIEKLMKAVILEQPMASVCLAFIKVASQNLISADGENN